MTYLETLDNIRKDIGRRESGGTHPMETPLDKTTTTEDGHPPLEDYSLISPENLDIAFDEANERIIKHNEEVARDYSTDHDKKFYSELPEVKEALAKEDDLTPLGKMMAEVLSDESLPQFLKVIQKPKLAQEVKPQHGIKPLEKLPRKDEEGDKIKEIGVGQYSLKVGESGFYVHGGTKNYVVTEIEKTKVKGKKIYEVTFESTDQTELLTGIPLYVENQNIIFTTPGGRRFSVQMESSLPKREPIYIIGPRTFRHKNTTFSIPEPHTKRVLPKFEKKMEEEKQPEKIEELIGEYLALRKEREEIKNILNDLLK